MTSTELDPVRNIQQFSEDPYPECGYNELGMSSIASETVRNFMRDILMSGTLNPVWYHILVMEDNGELDD